MASPWLDPALAVGFSLVSLTQLFTDSNATHSAPAALLVVLLCSTLLVRRAHPVAAVAFFGAGLLVAARSRLQGELSPRRRSPGHVDPRLLVWRARPLPARAARCRRAGGRGPGCDGLLGVPERRDRLRHPGAVVGRLGGRAAPAAGERARGAHARARGRAGRLRRAIGAAGASPYRTRAARHRGPSHRRDRGAGRGGPPGRGGERDTQRRASREHPPVWRPGPSRDVAARGHHPRRQRPWPRRR